MSDVTRIPSVIEHNNPRAAERLLLPVDEELRRLVAVPPIIGNRLALLAGVVVVVLFPASVQADGTPGVLHSSWKPGLPSVVIAGNQNAVDPVALRAKSGALLLAAESRGTEGNAVLVSRSKDGGRTWDTPRAIARAAGGNRLSAGAAGTLPSGRLVLALHEWNETRGPVTHVREQPAGVHHYFWSGFRRTSTLNVLISDDEGETWAPTVVNTNSGPTTLSAMGKVFTARGAAWLPVYGPADAEEMDSALSSVGLMKSEDDGKSWRFSHWVARASKEQGMGYGPGEVTVLPDGRWLGLLQGNGRRRGDYTRPRVCRAISSDGGNTWSVPQQKLLNHGCSTVTLDRDEIMVGGWKDRGIMFTVGTNAGDDWLYQDQVWWCIWYAKGDRGGTRLLKLDDGVLVVYHWMDKADPSRTEVRAQVVQRAAKPANSPPEPSARHVQPKWKWTIAEAYQVPDIPDAPAGIRIKTLLKLGSGDWICLGYVGSRIAGTAYGFAPTGICVLRSPGIEGPWKKVSDLPIPTEAGGALDTGTGAGLPGFMMQHSSGRLFVPFSTKGRKDVILTFSDDEGRTWKTVGSMAGITRLPAVLEADKIVEHKDGRLIFPMQRSFHGGTGKHPLFYVTSTDRGQTWSAPVFWATHPGTRYAGLPHGPVGDLRETGLAVLNEKRWLGIYRESRGTPAPENALHGPLSMPFLCLARSVDGGRTWTSSFGFLGVEPSIAALPGGAVMVAYRDDNLASVWLSYDQGASWQIQEDPAELPWRSGAAEAHTQWPPGGEPIIRVLDENAAVVICDTGLIPSGKLLPGDFKRSKELHGRVQVRFFRRVPASESDMNRAEE